MHGVSEVIAIILILMITISLAGLAYMFMSTTMSDVTSTAGSTVDTTTSSMLTSFTIESIDVAKVYLRNTGQKPLESLSVYVNDELATFNVTPSSIASGEIGTITVYSFIPDGATVKVTSSNGFSASKITTPCEKAVGCWNFDEGTGTIAYDSSPYGNTGTLNGPSWTSGKHDSGLLFDGTNDYVSAGNNTNTKPTGDMSITLLVYPSSSQAEYAGIIGNYLLWGWSVQQNFLTTNQYSFFYYVNASPEGRYGFSTYFNLTPNTWNYLVISKNGTLVTEYVNGFYANSFTGTSPTIHYNSNYRILIGNGYSLEGRYFNGLIDEVRIYNRAIY